MTILLGPLVAGVLIQLAALSCAQQNGYRWNENKFEASMFWLAAFLMTLGSWALFFFAFTGDSA